MEILSLKDLTNLACSRYGQLVTPIDIYNLKPDVCEQILKDVVEEYTYYIPMTKILNVNGSPSGTFLGKDIISVRNVRMDNFYFNKLSPRMNRRQRRFDSHTKMLFMPLSMPVIVECGAMYPYGRIPITEAIDTALVGDTSERFKLNNFRQGTLTVKIGELSWSDKDTDYSVEKPELIANNTESENVNVIYNKELQQIEITNLNLTSSAEIIVSYNTDTPVVQGLGLQDKLFIDLFIGRLMLALGNVKSEIVMEGDVIGFNNSELSSKGQELIDKTLELLNNSSTSYKVL